MLGVLMTLAEGTSGADTSTSYPPRGAAAAALRVLRLVAASAPEHARRIGAEGVPAAAVRAAVSTGTPETSRQAAESTSRPPPMSSYCQSFSRALSM